MPIPVSRTSRRTRSFAERAVRRKSSPPLGMAWTALVIRFSRIWRMAFAFATQGGIVAQVGRDAHAGVLEILLHELDGAREQVVDVDALHLRARLAGELEQVLDDRLRAADLLLGDVQVLQHLGRRGAERPGAGRRGRS